MKIISYIDSRPNGDSREDKGMGGKLSWVIRSVIPASYPPCTQYSNKIPALFVFLIFPFVFMVLNWRTIFINPFKEYSYGSSPTSHQAWTSPQSKRRTPPLLLDRSLPSRSNCNDHIQTFDHKNAQRTCLDEVPRMALRLRRQPAILLRNQQVSTMKTYNWISIAAIVIMFIVFIVLLVTWWIFPALLVHSKHLTISNEGKPFTCYSRSYSTWSLRMWSTWLCRWFCVNSKRSLLLLHGMRFLRSSLSCSHLLW